MTIDRERLAKLLGMIGSDHDGEALSAARMADRLVQEARLTWHEVLHVEYRELEIVPDISEDLRMVLGLQQYRSSITEWERGFLDTVEVWLRRGWNLTEKQRVVLDRIWSKVMC